MQTVQWKNLTAEIPIIGFTGALGSGCTKFATTLCSELNYKYYKLSDKILEAARQKRKRSSVGNMQDLGNDLRREFGLDYLALAALGKADAGWKCEDVGKYNGIVLDGIKNLGELQTLRQFPNFFSISLQADQDVRLRRLRDSKRFLSDRSFLDADKRDEQENAPYGQQIKLCNHFADIVLLNNEQIAPDAKEQLKEIVRNKLTTYYIPLFNKIVKGEPSYEHQPHVSETMMTTAYCQSKRSSCLKRHVGAVIARGDGEIIAVGFNEVPKGSQSCLLDDRYGWCARDIVLEKLGRRIKHCPNCGVAVEINSRCVHCGKKLTQFARRCSCGEDPAIDYTCRKCGRAVFNEFLPGRKPDTGKLLDICRAVHAEENAILNLTRIGIPTPEDAVLYTTTFPCNLCANKIIQSGIRKVVYTEPYITKEARELLKSKNVTVEGFEGVKSTAYFRLFS